MIEPSESAASTDVPYGTSGTKLAVHIHRVKFLVLRYWWILAICMAIGLTVQGYRCSQLTPKYISTSRMMISGQLNIIGQGAASVYMQDSQNFYGTQVALMKSPDTVAEAEARVQAIHPEVAVDPKAMVDANQELKTSIFDLHVTSSNPEYAPLLLNAVMDTYLANHRLSRLSHYRGNRAIGHGD